MTAAPTPTSVDPLSSDELARYGRQLLLPPVGVAGQRRLKAARVLVVGAGGLGSPVALYLAAAGVGTLGLVDDDAVDATNLHRQLLYGTGDVGRPKLDAAARRLTDLNPHVALELHPERLTTANARALVAGHDVVVDGTDNFAARYAVNDACAALGVPNVYGSVHRFEGQVAVFAAPNGAGGRGPCYRCLYPAPPPEGTVPSCAEGGVLGVLPGLVGMLQATEALKLLLGIGEPLVGRLLAVDALAMRFLPVAVARDPACPACGDVRAADDTRAPSPAAMYAPRPAEAGVVASAAEVTAAEVTATELAAALAGATPPVVVDVREPREWATGHLPGARHAPLATLDTAAAAIDPARPTVAVCAAGVRSAHAARRLRELGFADVRSLAGGVAAWHAAGGALVVDAPE